MLKNNELKLIFGGASVSATLLNSITKLISIFLDSGKLLGSSIRRIKDKKMC